MIGPGSKVAHYEIVSALGKGGMGEVWRARDTKLGRDVAIKTLPSEFAQDTDRLARFEREAKLLASLNHPNIAAIYGLEDSDDGRFIVLELIEGETLADRIARGAIPVDEALELAPQIVAALEAAHERGVIHRDLKPANIKVTPEGVVKVLDFGLAKAAAGDSTDPSLSQSPTLSMAATAAGVVLGTAAYMAPEQAKGRAVDKRADIWAFGAVLYEMVTGRPVFQGEDVTETVAAVVLKDPDLEAVPVRMRKLVGHCLERDPQKRLRDIGDALRLLDDTPTEARLGTARQGSGIQFPFLATAVILLAAILFAVLLWPREATEPPRVSRFEITAPPGARLPVGTPAVSIDGTVAYSVVEPDGTQRIYIRPIDDIRQRPLPGTEGGVHPFWSPPGDALAFSVLEEDLKIRTIDIEDQLVQNLTVAGGPWHGDWGANSDILLQVNLGVGRVSPGGGPTSIEAPPGEEEIVAHPYFLSDGERYLVWVSSADRSSIQLGRLGSAERTIVLDGVSSAPVLAPTPEGRTYLLYLEERNLMAQQFDERSGSVRGPAVVLVNEIAAVANPPIRPAVGVSPVGILAYQAGGSAEFGTLRWLDRSGGGIGELRASVSVFRPRLSPDGTQVAGLRTGVAGSAIYVTDLSRESSDPVTVELNRLIATTSTWAPVWDPDNSGLAYPSSDGTSVRYVDLLSREERSIRDTPPVEILDWSLDGRYQAYQDGSDLLVVSVDGSGEPFRIVSPNGSSTDGRFSPDGNYIAFTRTVNGESEVYLQALPPGTGLWRVSIDGGRQPRWAEDTFKLFYISQGQLMAVTVEPGTESPAGGVPDELFPLNPQLGYDVRADGQAILAFAAIGLDETVESAPITVVVNWWVELEERLGLR